VRRAERSDLQGLLALVAATGGHMDAAPAWAPVPQRFSREVLEGHAELFRDGGAESWVAIRDRRLVAFVLMRDASGDPLTAPAGAAELTLAATHPAHRRRGIGRAVVEHALSAAHDAGRDACVADWRSANLEASRFWPARGFTPVAIRMQRRIDPLAVERCRARRGAG
jgi:ribosomal protein S18 acetylase RimI-like enzyme